MYTLFHFSGSVVCTFCAVMTGYFIFRSLEY